jgi:ankyrin repeat protein
VSQNNEAVVQILFEKGANPFLRDVIGNTPLDLAATQSRSNMVSLILKHSSYLSGTSYELKINSLDPDFTSGL